MAELTTLTCSGGLRGSVELPPSKSYTHRAVLLASLADGESHIVSPLISRDTLATVDGCRAFGAELREWHRTLSVRGSRVNLPKDVVNVENSGTTLRFLTSVLASTPAGHSVLTGDESVRRRPMQPLLDALRELGAEAWSTRGNGCAPVVVKGGGIRGGKARMKGDVSSQFVSSLMISGALAGGDVTLELSEAVSRPYMDATVAAMSRFGISVERDGYSTFSVPAGKGYKPCEFTVPADMSSASFIGAGVALVGGKVAMGKVDQSLPQGDARIFKILRSMGVEISEGGGQVVVQADGGELEGGSFDLADTPDLLPVVAVLGLRAKAGVTISGVRHARFKETDRVAMMAAELAKLGAEVEEREDGLTVRPGHPRPAILEAHSDHRLFMAFSLASLLFARGSAVAGEDSVDVSYPNFLKDMSSLGAAVGRVAA